MFLASRSSSMAPVMGDAALAVDSTHEDQSIHHK
jgi:hypothetical protein